MESTVGRRRPGGFAQSRARGAQAAIGRIQLRRMSAWTAQRSAHAKAIAAACRQYAVLRVPDFVCAHSACDASCPTRSGCVHAYYKFYAYALPARLAEGWSRDRIIAAVNQRGVPCYQGSCSEVYLEKASDGTGWRPAQPLPVARQLGETSLMFLVHPTLTPAEIDKTCRVLSEVLASAAPGAA